MVNQMLQGDRQWCARFAKQFLTQLGQFVTVSAQSVGDLTAFSIFAGFRFARSEDYDPQIFAPQTVSVTVKSQFGRAPGRTKTMLRRANCLRIR